MATIPVKSFYGGFSLVKEKRNGGEHYSLFPLKFYLFFVYSVDHFHLKHF